jgi:hypothetical protein
LGTKIRNGESYNGGKKKQRETGGMGCVKKKERMEVKRKL